MQQAVTVFDAKQQIVGTMPDSPAKDVLLKINFAAKNLYDTKNATWVNFGQDKPEVIIRQYEAFCENVKNLHVPTPFDMTQYCHNLSALIGSISSPALKKALDEVLTQAVMNQLRIDREANLDRREKIAVYGTCGICYSVYLNILSALIPGVDYHIPASLLFLGVIGIVAAQVTAPYQNVQEATDRVSRISDQIISNSGVGRCYSVLYRVIEYSADKTAQAAEAYLDRQEQQGDHLALPARRS